MNRQSLEDSVSGIFNAGYYPHEVKDIIRNNLNPKFQLRPYQEEAFKRFDWSQGNNPNEKYHRRLLFQMATGSGKTLIMAGIMLHMYEKGYRNFIYFVNSTSIIDKTRDNFLNDQSSKYLFNETITVRDQKIGIHEVLNFEGSNNEDVNIVFTTIQGLHINLNSPKENSLTYEDFDNLKVVLISDEAHHINADTKSGRRVKSNQKIIKSWEQTVHRIFDSNPNNYLLEFTATADLTNREIEEKYRDKLLFNYPLIKFREDKYSKEVKVLQADMKPFDRALQAILLSQYRMKVFAENGLFVKPVILFKSKTIESSKDFFEEFQNGIGSLTFEALKNIKSKTSNQVLKQMFQYFDFHNINLQNLLLELREDFSEEKCVIVNSKNDSEQKQLIVNSLEDKKNLYRAVFAVDKLNEGWDVLNLFDIVRLYDTRDASKDGIGKTTMSEAQLIGRGARYCPFRLLPEDPLYQRKYDSDLNNNLRICEELFYHSTHNPRYIYELEKALVDIGIKAPKTIQKKLILKESFKETDFYKNEFVFINERIKNDRNDVLGIDKAIIDRVYKKKFYTSHSHTEKLVSPTYRSLNLDNRIYKLNEFFEPIIRKALNKLPFYKFQNLKNLFPNLNSMTEFIGDSNYLKDIKIELIGTSNQVQNPSAEMTLEALISALDEISVLIKKEDYEFNGTREFKPKLISEVFGQDENGKILNFSIDNHRNKEYGVEQRNSKNQKLQLDLSNEDWYAFNENYGTSEEKFLVKYVKHLKDTHLNDGYDFYLIRNERHFKVFTFKEGKAFEPDFVLFLKEEKTGKSLYYQIFIEPKGEHLITSKDSEIKERFLRELEHEYQLNFVFENKDFKLLGLPFFNEKNKGDFHKEIEKLFSINSN
ncbi:MAG: DEAD/DEAH box helicase family protein [Flavobacteriaceae bacterium]|nr:DEAD/DEAH box helicase family protein [Flavobacteriaceae bacterium]MCY4266402.1 DEAD/DEAH box helicase family protein [Flavobacteriaceae bacterium]MCY4298184.1 DEAD/DEAH box helicase family protein [Flavobacteriaceae bacterium]